MLPPDQQRVPQPITYLPAAAQPYACCRRCRSRSPTCRPLRSRTRAAAGAAADHLHAVRCTAVRVLPPVTQSITYLPYACCRRCRSRSPTCRPLRSPHSNVPKHSLVNHARDFVIEDICAETIRELETLKKIFQHDPTRTPSSGLQVPDIPDLVVLPVFKKNARFLLPFVMIVIAVD